MNISNPAIFTSIVSLTGPLLRCYVRNLPTWNMGTNSSVFLNLPDEIGVDNVYSVNVIIVNDLGTRAFPLVSFDDNGDLGGTWEMTPTDNLILSRISLGYFDSPSFTSTDNSRGRLLVWYISQ